MKVDLLPAAIMLIWGLWNTLHTLLFGWDKGQFYPDKGMLGWHFLIQWLCSLLVSDVLMLGEKSKIVLPQGFNCSLPCSVRFSPWFIIIQTDSLPLSARLLRPAPQPSGEVQWIRGAGKLLGMSCVQPGSSPLQPAAHRGWQGCPFSAVSPDWVTVPTSVRGNQDKEGQQCSPEKQKMWPPTPSRVIWTK